MSKDSSASYIHMHQPRLADLFEEFTRPHTSTTTDPHNPSDRDNQYGAASPTTIPSFLPVEDIYVAPQYQPPNPEDEDDVVPDQHAAFGITRAMDRRREAVWRDLGLEALVNGEGHGAGGPLTGPGGTGAPGAAGSGPGATLRGSGGGAAAAGMPVVRVREAGRKMGGRRVVGLR
ncbi:unnamed protein product [Penicillium olsonii]|uniref:Anaphase-promoting complex subunit 13 n=1 Tax=Penicillium olsonii TaxID=99116 RepID=A0A9W4MZA8_PENOL|nr:unnamed protein product [Penicillium olsonii]CAG7932617.1 unnamed protein product [Penicillium olsonii]CAG8083573.1 unnamed protein product [Penicillium olsonii]CAG8234282.1 unnamed protein product [Penicillium olsonii]